MAPCGGPPCSCQGPKVVRGGPRVYVHVPSGALTVPSESQPLGRQPRASQGSEPPHSWSSPRDKAAASLVRTRANAGSGLDLDYPGCIRAKAL